MKNSSNFDQRALTFPWEPADRTRIMIGLFLERHIGFQLSKDGITIEMAPTITAAETVKMVNAAIDARLKNQKSSSSIADAILERRPRSGFVHGTKKNFQ